MMRGNQRWEGLHLPNATERHVRHTRALHPAEAHAAKRDGERGESRASCGENATDVRTAIVPDEGSNRRSFGAITGDRASSGAVIAC